jgi:transposase
MSPAFIKGVSKELPNAKITFDKFHILKIINSVVDQVRREEAMTIPLFKKALNKARYICLKNDANLTGKERLRKEELSMSNLNLKSMQAMHIRENFQMIYLANNVDEFEYLLDE